MFQSLARTLKAALTPEPAKGSYDILSIQPLKQHIATAQAILGQKHLPPNDEKVPAIFGDPARLRPHALNCWMLMDGKIVPVTRATHARTSCDPHKIIFMHTTQTSPEHGSLTVPHYLFMGRDVPSVGFLCRPPCCDDPVVVLALKKDNRATVQIRTTQEGDQKGANIYFNLNKEISGAPCITFGGTNDADGNDPLVPILTAAYEHARGGRPFNPDEHDMEHAFKHTSGMPNCCPPKGFGAGYAYDGA